jgi:hypothetical protein
MEPKATYFFGTPYRHNGMVLQLAVYTDSLKLIMTPEDLGEIAGIFAGDGTLYRTQGGFVMEVRGDSREAEYYENHVKRLFSAAFGLELGVIKRYYTNKTGYVLGIRVCGKRTKEFLNDFWGFR